MSEVLPLTHTTALAMESRNEQKSEGKSRLSYISEPWLVPGELGQWEVSLPRQRWHWLILEAHPAQTIP